MPRLPLLLAALVVAVAAAGCLADSGSQGSGQPSAADADGAGSDPAPGPGSQGGNGTSSGNATSGNATASDWRNETRRSTFTGANVVFGIFGRSETFSVPDDVRNLTLLVKAPDAELTGNIDPPCDEDSPGCPAESYTTSAGRYEYRATDPPGGQWDISFFRGEGGAGQHRYVLTIAREVPAAR